MNYDIMLTKVKSKLVYKHMEGAKPYNLTVFKMVDFGDNKKYFLCKVKESGWYEEVIITQGDFEDNRVRLK